MRCLAFLSDFFAPSLLTIVQPWRALVRFGVSLDTVATLPSLSNAPGTSEQALLTQISRYDLIILQRVTMLPIVKMIKNICHLLDKPLVGVFDDNYIHLEHHNPCFFSCSLSGLPQTYRELINEGRTAEAEALVPALLQDRENGLSELKTSLGLYDLLIVTTEELREAYLPFNKNIVVLKNNIDQTFPERDMTVETLDEQGRFMIESKFGLVTVPGFYYQAPEKLARVLRIGYTGTETHRHDFDTTIKNAWTKLVKKYAADKWFVYIGDPYFAETSYYAENTRKIHIPAAAYETYRLNLRNLDIGIAPLSPTPFNMSKSDLKVMEYASWGIPSVAPDYVTYSRFWKHGENILLYKNETEFIECVEALMNNPALRERLGRNALEYVTKYRTEAVNAEERYLVLKNLVDSKLKFKTITPLKKELINV